MGVLRSKTNRGGLVVNGITLGDAPITASDGSPLTAGDTISEAWFVWSDSRLPSGIVHADGSVALDDPEL